MLPRQSAAKLTAKLAASLSAAAPNLLRQNRFLLFPGANQ